MYQIFPARRQTGRGRERGERDFVVSVSVSVLVSVSIGFSVDGRKTLASSRLA